LPDTCPQIPHGRKFPRRTVGRPYNKMTSALTRTDLGRRTNPLRGMGARGEVEITNRSWFPPASFPMIAGRWASYSPELCILGGVFLSGDLMKILVVEDEPLLALTLAEELAGAGHTVLGPAKTVAEGLDIIAADKPELAILNINLEDGSKGTDLAAVLVRRWNVPCLFVSGEMAEAKEHRDLALGYICKPYDPSTVLAAIDVARSLLEGNKPAAIPPGLELFN
jgi:CheY-like chemotaxis protein